VPEQKQTKKVSKSAKLSAVPSESKMKAIIENFCKQMNNVKQEE
jgi:hypothetical protein